MIYLVYGEQELLVNKMIDKIAKDTLKEIDEFNYIVLDAYKHDVSQVIGELESFCFSSDKKVVSLTNSYFLTNNNTQGPYESEPIEAYLENETEGTTFIISVNASKLDEKRTIVKSLRKIAKVVEVDGVNKKDLPRIVKQMFTKRNVEITDDALHELLSRVDVDMYQISNEVEKLSTYSNKIYLHDVEALTPKKMDDNIFDMIDAMFKKNSNKAFRIYNDLKSLGNEPVSLVSIIATQVRFLYQILVLSNKGYGESNIANELSAHPYRVKMGMEKVRNYSEYELEDLLDELSKLDIQIKTGDIDRFVGLELFILKMSN
ncbi:MAG: DNA polymerase III subunit delta [Bacilli bacterium]|nr:DNA polymerase III subunit delta [Bacilli bacterium]